MSEKEVRTVARAGGLEGRLTSTWQNHHIAKDIAAVWWRLGKRGFGGRLPEKEVPKGVARQGGGGFGMDRAAGLATTFVRMGDEDVVDD